MSNCVESKARFFLELLGITNEIYLSNFYCLSCSAALFIDSDREPNIRDLAGLYTYSYLPCRGISRLCVSTIDISEEERINALVFILQSNMNLELNCNSLSLIEFYRKNHQDYPTSLPDLLLFVSNMNGMNNDADNYCIENQVTRPAKNLENIPSLYKVATHVSICTICMDEIKEGDIIIELNCGHRFHSSSSDCLDDASILEWLNSNKSCPICKQEVIIPNPETEKKELDSQ
jgi:hypothetical protein